MRLRQWPALRDWAGGCDVAPPISFLALLCAVLLTSACGRALSSPEASPLGHSCNLLDSATAETRLPNGLPVFLTPRAFVEQGADYLALGDGTDIDSGTGLTRARVNDVDAVGALFDERGLARLIPLPPGTRHFESPKILRADAAATEVLWLDPDSANAREPQPARIMSARFDGRSWSTASTIVHVSRLLTSPEQTAEPMAIPGGIALVITESNADSGSFIELLVERNGIWSRRPVASGYRPLYPFLAALGNAWVLIFTGIDTSHAIGLFVVHSNDGGMTWSSPYLIAAGRAYEERLLALGQGLALVWIGEHEGYRPRGVHVAFSRDGMDWTTSSAFDPANDSTTAAMATAFDNSRIALVRLIGESADRVESVEIVSRTADDVLWTKRLMALTSPLLVKHGKDTITLLTDGVRRTASSLAPNMTLSWGRVRCE